LLVGGRVYAIIGVVEQAASGGTHNGAN
jgi:hypothetical protein